MTADTNAFGEERRLEILEMVRRSGRVRIGALAKDLGVTEPTIRKDLARLEESGKLRRTHGGAIGLGVGEERAISDRKIANASAKARIAHVCAELIRPGDSVYLDSGTTVLQIAEALTTPQVNVLTNGLDVALAIGDKPAVRHTLLGGQVRPAGGSVSGPLAVENLQRFTLDIAFIGVSGLTSDGITVLDFLEAQLKSAVIARSRRVVVPVDSSKIGVVDFAHVAPLGSVHCVVTADASAELIAYCTEAGIDLIDAASSASQTIAS